MTALLGSSGAGKTTLLRAVAGLVRPLAGTIALGGRDLAGVPVHRRRVAVVFQEPRLLPNLSVLDNVALPLRAAGVRRAQRHAQARALLDDVGLGGLADRMPGGLSGGEAQRTALARALCGEPELLMLDEPLAALDPNRREGLRKLIARVQRERSVTTLLITHDRTEAAELGRRIALIVEGSVVQHDVPESLFERPATPTAARFFGATNLLRGEVRGGRLQLAAGALPVPGGDGEAVLCVRPERLQVGRGPLRARVVEAVYQGSHTRVSLDAAGLALEAHVPAGQPVSPGAEVELDVSPGALWRIPDADPAGVAAG